MDYKNIIWIEDFDTKDSYYSNSMDDLDNEEQFAGISNEVLDKEKELYFSEKYKIAVDVKSSFLEAIKALDEQFGKYDCVVLDINLNRGFDYIDSAEEAKKKLKLNGVDVKTDIDFEKNAGYYLYLYLILKGFPSKRVSILTSNYGKGNLTEEWKNRFEEVGLIPPMAFNKQDIKAGIKNDVTFTGWLDNMIQPYYVLRGCIISMTGIILESIDKDKVISQRFASSKNDDIYLAKSEFKEILSNIREMPLIHYELSDNKDVFEKLEQKAYFNVARQLSHKWDRLHYVDEHLKDRFEKRIDGTYRSLMKMLRNWIAHNKLNNSSFNSFYMAFIFGIGMRGFFDIESLSTEKKELYLASEKILLNLLSETIDLTGDTILKEIPDKEKEIKKMLKKSSADFYKMIKNGEYLSKIPQVISKIGDWDGNTECKPEYLLRSFGHSLFPTKLEPNNNDDVFDYGFKVTIDTSFLEKESIELKYFCAVFDRVFG